MLGSLEKNFSWTSDRTKLNGWMKGASPVRPGAKLLGN